MSTLTCADPPEPVVTTTGCKDFGITVRQLRKALKEFDGDLPVFLEDWQEQYSQPAPLNQIYYSDKRVVLNHD